MGCTKNPKRFLGVSYLGAHDWTITSISRFGAYSWAKYNVVQKCRACEVRAGDRVADEADLVAQGFSAEKLQGIDGYFGCQKIDELRA